MCLSEVYKASLILFYKRKPLLLAMQLSLLILRFLPIDRNKRYRIMMDAYEKRIKLYGIFTLIGGFIYVPLFIKITVDALRRLIAQ
jgi:hypothetical protein